MPVLPGGSSPCGGWLCHRRLAHEEPYTEKGSHHGYGKRVKQPFGTLMQIPVSVCKTCRRNMRIRQNLRWIGMISGAAIALIALAILSIWVPLNSTENASLRGFWPAGRRLSGRKTSRSGTRRSIKRRPITSLIPKWRKDEREGLVWIQRGKRHDEDAVFGEEDPPELLCHPRGAMSGRNGRTTSPSVCGHVKIRKKQESNGKKLVDSPRLGMIINL